MQPPTGDPLQGITYMEPQKGTPYRGPTTVPPAVDPLQGTHYKGPDAWDPI